MAEIKFVGFVSKWSKNDPQHPDWAMRVSEPHRKQEDGHWKTIAWTNRTVKSGWDVKIDFTQFKDGDRVEVVGKELTETYEDSQGNKVNSLVVKAESVEIAIPMSKQTEPVKELGPDWVSEISFENEPF